MCGLAGFIDSRGLSSDRALGIGSLMGKAIKHRGPDDSGVWFDCTEGVVMAHQRLSIIDLSKAGRQPMASASGRYVISFNGEIYNHQKLRRELETKGANPVWRGYSDTETLVALFDTYGIAKTLNKLIGMFAISIWDCEEKSLYLARDRIGEKPLYYGEQNNIKFFSSELKSILAHPEFIPDINRDALSLFMQHGYVPHPYSIFKNISKLRPGCFVNLSNFSTPISYWSLSNVISQNCLEKQSWQSNKDILYNVEANLANVVGSQMQSDVPIGSFLSGGVDSTLITSMMQQHSSSPIKTFSIGFEDENFNEAPYARAIAKQIGTCHFEHYVSENQLMDVVPKLSHIYDEPFADSSQIPTFLISQIASKELSVALTGDGGDELFGGYNRYTWGASIWSKTKFLPSNIRMLISYLLKLAKPQKIDQAVSPMFNVLPKSLVYSKVGMKVSKIASILASDSDLEVYRNLVSTWSNPTDIVLNSADIDIFSYKLERYEGSGDLKMVMMYLDMLTYLPDDILVKVDRAAMGVSLETRVPFLDKRIVELAMHIPIDMKIRNGIGKWCLRKILYGRVPKALVERPKMGFGAPIGQWLKGPLRDWAEDLLDESELIRSGYLNASLVRSRWEEHIDGKNNWEYHIWNILMFEAWRREVEI